MKAYCDPAFCYFVDAGGNCEDCWNARAKAKRDERAFTHPDGSQHWAHCRALFGHQECLQNEGGGVHHE
jgi:hypothetical protein